MNMDIISYNIRLGLDSCLDDIADAIIDYGPPDILALQEVGHHWNMGERVDQTQYLANRLKMHGTFCGALKDDHGGQYGIALLTKAPHDVISRRDLPRVDDEQRVCLITRLETPIPVTVVTSHLSIREPERRQQAQLLKSVMENIAGPAILLGDFNARPDSFEYNCLAGSCIDAFAAFGTGPAVTFSVVEPHRQIDYIMVSKNHWHGQYCHVLRDVRTSDHFPISARVQCKFESSKIADELEHKQL